MGVQGAGNVRLSIPLNFTETDLEIFLAKIPAVLNELAQTL
jgi:4-aminobutyrate aminotransferase-like enzyme